MSLETLISIKKENITRVSSSTGQWPNHTTDFVKLTGTDPTKIIGPNMILKVMAGDLFTTSAKYYYQNNNSTSGSYDPLSQAVGSFINVLTSPNKGSALGKSFSGAVQPSLQSEIYNFIKNTEPSNGNTLAPKAYINIVFLDEQFHFIDKDNNDPGVGTDIQRVSDAGNLYAAFPLITQKAQGTGGFLFI